MIIVGNKSFVFNCVYIMELHEVFIWSSWPKGDFQIVSPLLNFQFKILKYDLKV